MLTLKQITEDKEGIIRKLAKKLFDGREPIENVIAVNDTRKATQGKLDANLAELNKISKSIGLLLKEGKKDEAEAAKQQVASIKEANKTLEADMKAAEEKIIAILSTIPNIPCDEVPEGKDANDNVIERIGGNKVELPEDALPHWELAKKYNLIDFDLGVKIPGAGFPVYIGKGARLQRALIDFFLDEAQKSGYTEIMPPTVVN